MTIERVDAGQYDGGANMQRGASKVSEDIATKLNEIIDAVNLNTAEVQAGSETLAAATSVVVTFPTAFTATPKVVATAQGNFNVWITGKSATGCTINVSAAYTGDIDWIASV